MMEDGGRKTDTRLFARLLSSVSRPTYNTFSSVSATS